MKTTWYSKRAECIVCWAALEMTYESVNAARQCVTTWRAMVVRYSHKHYTVIDKTRVRDDDMRSDDMTTTTPEYRHVISDNRPLRRYRNVIGPTAAAPAPATVAVRIPITCCWQRCKFSWKCRSRDASGFRSERMRENTATNASQHAARRFACVLHYSTNYIMR